MKTLLIILSFTIGTLSISQTGVFMQKMGEALGQFSQATTPKDYINVSFKFEQIAGVETENWLPLYYHAMSYTMASYGEKNEDAAKKDAHLDMAFETIKKLKILAPNESEIFALEALFYTAKLSVDPMSRGQKYSGLSMASIEKALALNSNNPRAKQLKIANEFGMAQFFGTDTEPICKKAQVVLAEWDNYKIASQIHPNWGKEHIKSIAESCQPKTETKSSSDTVSTKKGHDLTLKIADLKSNKGIVLVQLMDENHKVLKSVKGDIDSNTSTIILENVEPGTYAIRYFHDENTNMKFDSDKYGRPMEGYGFSNNAKGFMGSPKIKKTLFSINSNLSLSLKINN